MPRLGRSGAADAPLAGLAEIAGLGEGAPASGEGTPAPGEQTPAPGGAAPAALDEFDLALLDALAADARLSKRALARIVGMSPPAVADRIERLERAGIIRGYRVEVDWSALGYPVVVYLAVTAGPGVELDKIITAIGHLPEALDMCVVTGSLDLLVRLRVRDHMHLRSLLLTQIFTIPGVQRTETFLSLADIESPNPAAALLGQLRASARTATS